MQLALGEGGQAVRSHPSRVRGLKSDEQGLLHRSGRTSHPSRVRGLKSPLRLAGLPHPGRTFTGAWIEIAICTVNGTASRSSHPSRVRGLKIP